MSTHIACPLCGEVYVYIKIQFNQKYEWYKSYAIRRVRYKATVRSNSIDTSSVHRPNSTVEFRTLLNIYHTFNTVPVLHATRLHLIYQCILPMHPLF